MMMNHNNLRQHLNRWIYICLLTCLNASSAYSAIEIIYAYDDLNRLEKVTRSDGPEVDYDYDEVGNIINQSISNSPDTDGDLIANFVDWDDDNDGISDEWELFFSLNPLSSADAGLDADGDGQSNLAEFLEGTDPLINGQGYIPQLNKKEKLLFSLNETAIGILASMVNAKSCSDIAASYGYTAAVDSTSTGHATLDNRSIEAEIIQDTIFSTVVKISSFGIETVGSSGIQDIDMIYHFSRLGETLDIQGAVQIDPDNAGSSFEHYDNFTINDYYWGPVYNSRTSNGVLDSGWVFITKQSGPRTKWRKTSQYRRQNDSLAVNSLSTVTLVQIAPDNAPLCKISMRKAGILDDGITLELTKSIKVQTLAF